MDDARLIDLETRMAFQEATLQSLNDIVVEQAQRLEHLERLCRALLEREPADGSGTTPASRSHEPPPHY